MRSQWLLSRSTKLVDRQPLLQWHSFGGSRRFRLLLALELNALLLRLDGLVLQELQQLLSSLLQLCSPNLHQRGGVGVSLLDQRSGIANRLHGVDGEHTGSVRSVAATVSCLSGGSLDCCLRALQLDLFSQQ